MSQQTRIPPQLFKPGDGTPPPCFAGREDDERALRSYAEGLDQRDCDGKTNIAANYIVYGPRGNGKTALLERLRTWAERRSNWHVLSMNVSEDAHDARSASEFLAATPWFRKLLRTLSESKVELSGGLAGGGAGFGIRLPETAGASWRIDQALAAASLSAPCLLLIDEAHRLPADLCAKLLDASRMLRVRGAPLLMVLAGTPALQDTLSSSGVSNWDRAERLPLGRLPKEAALRALTEPLAAQGVSCSDQEALALAGHAMQQYAYFTQLCGSAVVETLNALASHAFDKRCATDACELFEKRQSAFYADRRTEVRKIGCVAAAACAWGALRECGGRTSAEMLVDVMERFAPSGSSGEEAFGQLCRLGVLWNVEGLVEAGIPSLMASVVAHGGPPAQAAHVAGQSAALQFATPGSAVGAYE